MVSKPGLEAAVVPLFILMAADQAHENVDQLESAVAHRGAGKEREWQDQKWLGNEGAKQLPHGSCPSRECDHKQQYEGNASDVIEPTSACVRMLGAHGISFRGVQAPLEGRHILVHRLARGVRLD